MTQETLRKLVNVKKEVTRIYQITWVTIKKGSKRCLTSLPVRKNRNVNIHNLFVTTNRTTIGHTKHLLIWTIPCPTPTGYIYLHCYSLLLIHSWYLPYLLVLFCSLRETSQTRQRCETTQRLDNHRRSQKCTIMLWIWALAISYE